MHHIFRLPIFAQTKPALGENKKINYCFDPLSPVPAMFALLVIAVSFVVNKRYIHEWTPTAIVCHRMRFGCTLEPDSIQCLFRNFSQTKLELPNSLVRSGANLYFVSKFNAIAISMQHRSYSNVYRHTIHDFGEIQRIACWHKNLSERVIECSWKVW